MRRMIRALPALALLVVLLAVACSSGDGDGSGASLAPGATIEASPSPLAADCAPARPHAAGETRETLASGGVDRQYLLHIPEAYTGGKATALVLVFHPFNGTAQSMAELTAFATAAAEQRSWISVYPEGLGAPQSWNAAAFAEGPDDVLFVRELLASLQASLCVDAARVYATGFSNGGAMALRAACEIPDAFGAVAPVAAPFPACQTAVPIIAFHGSLDGAVPYDGGITPDGVNLPPVHRAVSEWARAIGCDALPAISRAAMDVELATYGRCPLGDNEALLYTVLNGGHTWPGAAIDYPVDEAGVTTHAISANDVILDFFDAHRKP
jgi:polyhydroxybutyrate depolymerase